MPDEKQELAEEVHFISTRAPFLKLDYGKQVLRFHNGKFSTRDPELVRWFNEILATKPSISSMVTQVDNKKAQATQRQIQQKVLSENRSEKGPATTGGNQQMLLKSHHILDRSADPEQAAKEIAELEKNIVLTEKGNVHRSDNDGFIELHSVNPQVDLLAEETDEAGEFEINDTEPVKPLEKVEDLIPARPSSVLGLLGKKD